ncbi:MAG: Fe-S cluster assembly ATPase SufC [Bacteroidales bacterium]|jgi:Fe-S cluster assembly ATP-binding protein|nr:Fe-S cluster assembly ATPase SufC [Bacteroidales bacterium]
MLKIKDLHASINGTEILRGINLQINAGEVHAIMGPNGSGKSTLCNVLVGRPEYAVTMGTVVFKDSDLLTQPPEERARRGLFLSFQSPVEIPGVPVANFLKAAVNERLKFNNRAELAGGQFLKYMHGKEKLLNMPPELINRSVNEGFSGGEKKKSEIFQMAMLEPDLAILDEIDSGLDVDALRNVSDAIGKLKTDTRAMLVITHHCQLLSYVRPNFVHVLSKGRIIRTGGPELAWDIEDKGYDWIQEEKP